MRKQLGFLALGVMALMFAVGCGDDPRTRLRIVHASPDAPAVDVLVNGSSVATGVAYKQSSDYLTVKSGTTRVQVRPTGTTTDVIDVSPKLDENKDYTALAVNYVSSIEPLLLTDDNTIPPSGQARVRVVHGAPSAPNVDVYVTAPNADINTATPVLTNVPFKAAAYQQFPAGDIRIRVAVTGTKIVAIDSGTLTLKAGQVRTVVALDNAGGGAPFQAIVLNDRN